MTVFIIFLVISFIAYIFFCIFGAIVRPIFDFIYYSIIKLLTSQGISFLAARAIVSVIIIIVILSIIF